MKEIKNIPCPNCGSTEYEKIYYGTDGKAEYEYIACSDCTEERWNDDWRVTDRENRI